jgi:GT2 family glycosyltransferase
MINVCVPTLRRYDMLKKMIASLSESTLRPDSIYVIDNGRSPDRMQSVVSVTTIPVHVHLPDLPMGVAESWNWFLDNVPEERVITNDDITFAPESLAALVERPEDLVWGSGFSCFLIRDSCVKKLGRFDESISPGYGYYEDDDYLQRLDGRGTKPRQATAENVACGIVHENSSTLRAADRHQILEHHRRFKIAQANYMKKWGLTTI